MDKENLLRLIAVDESVNDAEAIISQLRNSGYSMRSQTVEDDEDLQSALEEQPFDICLLQDGMEYCPLNKAIEIIEKTRRDLPIVVLGNEHSEEAANKSMEAGAADYVRKDNFDHLRLVINRELDSLASRRKARNLEQMYRESEKRNQALLSNSRDAIAYVHDGMHVYANPVYLEMFGFDDLEEVEGAPIMDMVAPDEQAKFKEFLRNYGQGKSAEDEFKTKIIHPDGSVVDSLMEFSPATIDGEACTQIIIRSQTGNTRELEDKIKFLSKQDLVTGLYNRQYFMEELELAVSNAISGDTTGAVLYILFDNCKQMRESVGIAACDLVIGDVAKLVDEIVPEEDLAARFSDNAFSVLIRNKSMQEIERIANEIRANVESKICEAGNLTITTTVSIGISLINESTTDAQEIINNADLACEIARKNGGNQVHLHNPVADEAVSKQRIQNLQETINNALEDNNFQLVYQPVVSLHGDTKERYEVLVRLKDDQGNTIMPGEFFSVAEKNNQTKKIDRWVIKHAIEALAKRIQSGHDTAFLIKVSGETLADSSVLPWLRDELASARLAGDSIIFEIAETVATSQLKLAKQFYTGLKELHCGVIIDHFGSGPNSFNLLKHIQADYLKIDGSYIHNLAENKDNQAMVKSITEMAREMNKQTIAEFVEDASSLALLWQYGIQFIQGYFLQEPDENLAYDFSGETL